MWFFKKKTLPYSLKDEVKTFSGPLMYKMFNGVRNSDQKEVSIFEIKPGSSSLSQALASNMLKMWKSFRHPAIPAFIESYEDNGTQFIVSEKVEVFDRKCFTDNELIWAVHSLVDFLTFLSDSAKAVHGNLVEGSLFMTSGHEICIGGLQWLSIGEQSPIRVYMNEWKSSSGLNDLEIPDDVPPYAIDAYFVGSMISEWGSKIPRPITKIISKWKQINARMPPPSQLLSNDFWNSDKFSQVLLFLKELPLKDPLEREMFFKGLKDNLHLFSKEMQLNNILSQLLSALSFSPTPAILEPIFALGGSMEGQVFGTRVVPSLISLFESKDRNLRVQLLLQVDSIIPHLDKPTINDKIFVNIIGGMADSVPQLRQATIVSMVPICSQLTISNIRILIRELKRLQSDPDAQIRTNSVICIAKISEYIEEETRSQVLSSAFSKAATDPYHPCRKAAITAYKSTIMYFNNIMIATSCIPSIAKLCVDQNEEVRLASIRLMKQFIDVLWEADAAKLAEVENPPDQKSSQPIKKPEDEPQTEKSKQKTNEKKSLDEKINVEESKKTKEEKTNEKANPEKKISKKLERPVIKVVKSNDGWDDDFEEEDEKEIPHKEEPKPEPKKQMNPPKVLDSKKTIKPAPIPTKSQEEIPKKSEATLAYQATAEKKVHESPVINRMPPKRPIKPQVVVQKFNEGWDDLDWEEEDE